MNQLYLHIHPLFFFRFYSHIDLYRASQVGLVVKNPPADAGDASWEDLLEKEIATCSSIVPGKFHGQRSLVGYNPWGHKEVDTTE